MQWEICIIKQAIKQFPNIESLYEARKQTSLPLVLLKFEHDMHLEELMPQCPLEKLGGYHPFFIQIACSNIFEALSEHQKTVNLQKVTEKVYEEAEDHFKYMWHQLTDSEKACLQSVVESKELDQNLLYIARKLEKKGILMEIGGYYEVFSLCFKDFIKNGSEIEKHEENMKERKY